MIIKPEINKIKTVDFPAYHKISLSNGIEVSMLKVATPDIIKMDIVVNAGRYYEKDKAVAKATVNLINEGTVNMSSKEIAEKIDYYGATLNTGTNMDTSELQLFCLAKYFDDIIPLIHDILTQASFPTDEIEKYKKRNIEKLKIELSKNEVLSYRYFTEKLYGKNHPYGYNTEIRDYQRITKAQLVSHYEKFYGAENIKIFITGNIDNDKIKTLDKYLGSIKRKNNTITEIKKFNKANETGKYRYSGKGEYQTALKIGRTLFNRSHPDYPAIYLLNTVLGGYFGSRLNTNLRENKGYTYGIYSSLDMMRHDGYFMIATEVGKHHTQATINEIYKEMSALQNNLIPENELELVKNYIKGNFLSLINGQLNTIKLIKTIETANLKSEFLTDFIDKIDNITAIELKATAKKYLNAEDMTEVLVTPHKDI